VDVDEQGTNFNVHVCAVRERSTRIELFLSEYYGAQLNPHLVLKCHKWSLGLHLLLLHLIHVISMDKNGATLIALTVVHTIVGNNHGGAR
jgi:hypothetical protein